MIQRKIILDKRGIAIQKIMILILVILTLATVLILVFKVDINELLRRLPGYSVPENDTVIDLTDKSDVGAESSCVEIGKMKLVEDSTTKWAINIGGVETNLRWDGNKDIIKVFREEWHKGNVEVAEIKGGKVFLDPGFFNVDSSGKIRFSFYSSIYKEVQSYVEVLHLVKLYGSYSDGMNTLCAGEWEEIDYTKPEEEIPVEVKCEFDNLCENMGYKYCVKGLCESGQMGSLCENDGDCDVETCVFEQQDDLGFCGYETHSNCEEFRGDNNDMCYCEGCKCGNYEIFFSVEEKMDDGTKWICNSIFEHIMPQSDFLAPCFYAEECKSEDITSDIFSLNYGGGEFRLHRCL